MVIDLVEFLHACIAEDEAAARERSDDDFYVMPDGPAFEVVDMGPGWVLAARPDRVLAECEAKRQIVEMAAAYLVQPAAGGWDDVDSREHHHAEQTLQLLALPYANRPAYREEWRP